MSKFFNAGDTVEAFLNSKWVVGIVLNHEEYEFEDFYVAYEVDTGTKVFASFPTFLKGKPLAVDTKYVKKLSSDLGILLYD